MDAQDPIIFLDSITVPTPKSFANMELKRVDLRCSIFFPKEIA